MLHPPRDSVLEQPVPAREPDEPSDTPQSSYHRLTSGSLLARNSFWNLLGNGAPMLVAVACIPILIRGLGKDRFGVLTLAWALIGYASLFDLGLGRALTQLVAHKLGQGEENEIPALAWTSLALMLLLGFLGTATILITAPFLVVRALHVPLSFQHEAVESFRLLGFSVPFVILTAGLRGLLEAYQRFHLTAALRIPMGIVTFAGPLLVIPFSRSLVPVVGTLAVGRALGFIAYLLLCLRVVPRLRQSLRWDTKAVRSLLSFGGWMTVSNVVGPLMVTLDRFLIGGLVSITAVSYYVSSYEAVTKLLLLPVAIMGVMFPAFSTGFVQDPERTSRLFLRSLKALFAVLFPITLCIIALAHEGLRVWLGTDFAQHSYRVLQWLAVGVFINSMSQVPFAFLQGAGRPDLTAKLHLVEVPLYIGLLFWIIRTHGIEGAAIAWTLRMGADALFLFILSRRMLLGRPINLPAVLSLICALALFAVAASLNDPVRKGIFLLFLLLSLGFLGWFYFLRQNQATLARDGVQGR